MVKFASGAVSAIILSSFYGQGSYAFTGLKTPLSQYHGSSLSMVCRFIFFVFLFFFVASTWNEKSRENEL